MRSDARPAAIIIALALLAPGIGCSANGTEAEATTEPSAAIAKECSDPRPEMCTQDYRPVCATRDTGIRCVTEPCPASEQKTYSNACSACSDPKVMRWVAGPCPDPPDAPKPPE